MGACRSHFVDWASIFLLKSDGPPHWSLHGTTMGAVLWGHGPWWALGAKVGHQKLKETQIVVVVAAGHYSKPGWPDDAHWNIGRQPHYFGSGLDYLYRVGDIQPPYPHDRRSSSKVYGWLPEK